MGRRARLARSAGTTHMSMIEMGRLAEVLPTRPLGDWGAALLPRPFGEKAGVRGQRRWMYSLSPSPLWGEGWGEGQRRSMGSLLFDVWLTLRSSAGRDMRPAAHLLFFASPKKRRQKKGDPTGRVPSLRCGQPAMLVPGAVLRNSLCSLRSRRSNNRSKSDHEAHASCGACARPRPCASRHGQRGVEPQHGPSLRSAPKITDARAERSDGPNGFATPLRLRLRCRACGVARAPQDARVRGLTRRGCLNEARQRAVSSAAHPASAVTQVCPAAKRRGRRRGGAFFAYFLARARKQVALPGRVPASGCMQSQRYGKPQQTYPTPSPSPQPSPQRGEGAKTQAWAEA